MTGELCEPWKILLNVISGDRNAIKVENIARTQVGHLSRLDASRLAPLMDRNQITVEGVMHEGNCT